MCFSFLVFRWGMVNLFYFLIDGYRNFFFFIGRDVYRVGGECGRIVVFCNNDRVRLGLKGREIGDFFWGIFLKFLELVLFRNFYLDKVMYFFVFY